jgi:hypothetical protein
VIFLESNANVLSLWVFSRVTVVPYVAGFCGENTMIATELAVLAREPRCASLAEDDVSWDDIFSYNAISDAPTNSSLDNQTYLRSSLLLTVYQVHLLLRWLVLGPDARNVLQKREPG